MTKQFKIQDTAKNDDNPNTKKHLMMLSQADSTTVIT